MDIGLEQLKQLSLDSPDIETVRPKAKRSVKLTFTVKEFEAYSEAVEQLIALSSTPEFSTCLHALYPMYRPGEIKSAIVTPIVESLDKLGKRESTKKSPVKENNFFIKVHPATPKSRQLYSKVKNAIKPGSLKLDPNLNTSISDSKVYLKAYFELKGLKTDDGYNTNAELQSLLPMSFKGVTFVSTNDYKKVSIDAAKELIGWTKK
jgi:hypothetical protein